MARGARTKSFANPRLLCLLLHPLFNLFPFSGFLRRVFASYLPWMRPSFPDNGWIPRGSVNVPQSTNHQSILRDDVKDAWLYSCCSPFRWMGEPCTPSLLSYPHRTYQPGRDMLPFGLPDWARVIKASSPEKLYGINDKREGAEVIISLKNGGIYVDVIFTHTFARQLLLAQLILLYHDGITLPPPP